MIPQRQLPKELELLMLRFLSDPKEFSLDDFISSVIVAVLEIHHGNRIHAARQLKMNIRTLRTRLQAIEALGYEVPQSKNGRPRKEV